MQESHEMKVRVEDLPIDDSLRSEEGWQDMTVRWIVTDKTVGATEHVLGITTFPPGAKHRVHRHPNVEEAQYLLKGSGIARVGDAEIRQRTGDVVFVPKNEWHGFENDTESETVMLWTYGGASSLEAAGYVQRDRDSD